MNYDIEIGDVFEAIGIGQSFTIMDVIIPKNGGKKQLIVTILRNGFETFGEVDYAKYCPLLLNEECYKKIRIPMMYNSDLY